MEVAVGHPLTNVQHPHPSYDSHHSYPSTPQLPDQHSRHHHQNSSQSRTSFSPRRRAEMSAARPLPELSVDGQNHDRMEDTITDASRTVDDQYHNRQHINRAATGADIVGQAHDRIDAEMENSGTLPNGHVPEASASAPRDLLDSGTAADVIDTTPDSASAESSMPADVMAPSTHLLDIQASNPLQPPSIPGGEDLVRITSNGSTIYSGGAGPNVDTPTEVRPSAVPTPLDATYFTEIPNPPIADSGQTMAEASGQAGSPTMSPASSVHEEEEDDNSGDQDSGEDEDEPFWARFEEDKSEANEEELRQIENREKARESVSAEDHEHWEHLFFEELDDPEYIPGVDGRIDWTVMGVNGTPDKPNVEKIMRSPSALIGGFYWNIKYFPRGNDGTSQLSVYIECSKTPHEKQDKAMCENASATPITEEIRHAASPRQTGGEGPSSVDNSEILEPGESETATELMMVESPGDAVDRSWRMNVNYADETRERWEVAAQIGCVVYNPQEPRVSYHGKSEHHFDEESPDWGWTRFHGPWSEIHRRQHFQRQALLRNDTLAFTAYIRVVKDETRALWWHPSKGKNERDSWDSVAKTGLRAFSTSWDYTTVLSAALSTWLHLAPVRDIIRKAYLPNPIKDAHMRPRWLLQEMKGLLLAMQQSDLDHSTLSLQRIYEVLKWYGRDSKQISDVIEMWDIIREILNAEAFDEDSNSKHEDLFSSLVTLRQSSPFTEEDTPHSYGGASVSKGSTGALVREVARSVQGAVDGAVGSKAEAEQFWGQRSSNGLPSILQIELQRRRYIKKSRRWNRLSHKIALNEEINLTSWFPTAGAEAKYTLHGMVVHDGDLEARDFCTMVRPGGPGTKWVKYANRKSRQEVVFVTRKQAIEAHEGVGDDRQGCQPVAYVVLYIRNDLLPTGSPIDTASSPRSEASHSSLHSPKTGSVDQEGFDAKPLLLPIQIYNSNIFAGYQGKGNFDFWGVHLGCNVSELAFEIRVPQSSTCRDVQKHLASVMKLAETPEQCLIWAMNPSTEYSIKGAPHLQRKHGDGNVFEGEYGQNGQGRQRLWVHVIPSTQAASSLNSGSGLDESDSPMSGGVDPSSEHPVRHTTDGEDTVMAETEGPSTSIERSVASESTHPAFEPYPTEDPGEIYIFLKTFDAESQTLKGVGSYLVKRTEKIADITRRLLQLPESVVYDHWIETYRYESQKVMQPDRVLELGTFYDGVIIIAQKHLDEIECQAIEGRGDYPHASEYISYLSLIDSTPALRSPHLTRNYFGSEYLSVSIRNGRPHGHGTHIALTGDAYTGQWIAGQKWGLGTMSYANEDTYRGMWKRDFPEGEGEMVYANTGNTYIGGFKKGKRHGKGTMRFEVADEELALCRICYEAEMDALLFDCGHVVACEECARQVEVCPVCRRDVKAVVRIWRT